MDHHSDLLTLKELCSILSISPATGRNWLRLDKLVPTKIMDHRPYFSRSYVRQLKNDISSGKNTALKKRRNKGFVSGNGIYRSYISSKSPNNAAVHTVLDTLAGADTVPTGEQISLLLAECALQLICQRERIPAVPGTNLLRAYLMQELEITNYSLLIDDLITSPEAALDFVQTSPQLFAVSYTYEPQEDIPGLLYISLKNISSRKATGSYYTPTETVQELIGNLFENDTEHADRTVLDPCCGTGNFLLQLPEDFPLSNIYGCDIDETSIKITRINLALKFQPKEIAVLFQHITVSDFLTAPISHTYDFIIGNPPWGSSFSDAEKSYFSMHYQCACTRSMEAYDLFLERSLSLLKKDGALSFVLPKAVLNVKTHAPIRRILLHSCSIARIDFLKDTFHKVQCPCILLQLVSSEKPFSCIGMRVTDKSRSFVIQRERAVTADCFSFLTTDREYEILEKIKRLPNQTTLKNQADFALGIVTGNNKKYISDQKTDFNERILKGSDISRYRIRKPQSFITFCPEHFQQVAEERYYRAPEKLCYRFVCREPVFAYDDKQTLSLNSCNILIPHVEGLDMKYILAILNSGIVRFLFQKQFDSLKVLRSHIEQIPIPLAPYAVQEEIIAMVNALLAEENEKKYLIQNENLDKVIAGLFDLTDEEYEIVHSS